MPTIKRTDDALWFSHVHGQGGVAMQAALDALAPGQRIQLVINGVAGTWERSANYHGDPNGTRTRSLKPADAPTRVAWSALPRGVHVPLALGAVGPAGPVPVAPAGLVQAAGASTHPEFQSALGPNTKRPNGPTLCIGVDVAWWGGGQKESAQTETVAWIVVDAAGTAGDLRLRRVDLRPSFNQNAGPTEATCDPDAELLLGDICEVIDAHRGVPNIVVSIDAPLRAVDRGLAPRSRVGGTAGTLARRAPEDLLAAAQARLGGAWRATLNIMPGAPLVPRIVALVDGLAAVGFQLYDHPGGAAAVASRTTLECFPAESRWAVGVLGYHAPFVPDDVLAYKADEGLKLAGPWPQVFDAATRALWGFGPTLGVGRGVFNGWTLDFARFMHADPDIMSDLPLGRLAQAGKPFDDAVESVMAAFVAVSFVQLRAHVFVDGNGADGHIIGPGR